MDEQMVRNSLVMVEQLELRLFRTLDSDIDGMLLDEVALIRQELRMSLGIDPYRDMTVE